MAGKPDEVNIVPTEGASLLGVAESEKQKEPSSTTETFKESLTASEKAYDTIAGTDDLSVINKDENSKEEKEKEEKGRAVVATAPTPQPNADNTTDTVTPTAGPFWPETSPEHPLTRFYDSLETLITEASHSEVYGIELTKSNPFHTKLILQKFLRANQNDLEKAKQQLIETLRWRRDFNPVSAAGESFEESRFDGLGYVLEVEGVPESPNAMDVVTFNIYGAVKDNKATFGDLEGFLRWRVGLMEKSVQKLNLGAATKPIPNFGEGPDPYQGFQIHDYLQVSFLRQDPVVKAATKETIAVLGRYYPETLSRKFFVNVPIVMGWLFSAMKMVISKETVKKFTVLSYGNQLATELGPNVPRVYGGNARELQEIAEGMKFKD